MRKYLTIAAALAAVSTPASAADIWLKQGDVYIKGDIVSGDHEKFRKIAANLRTGRATVVMKSDGGKVKDALNIGIDIRAMKWRTVVVDECYSACALIWLAGLPRAAFSDSEIGFHAVYNEEDKSINGGSNAVVGAYLAKLGFDYDLIYKMIDAGPDSLNMLDYAKAGKMGITMTVLPTQRKEAQRQ